MWRADYCLDHGENSEPANDDGEYFDLVYPLSDLYNNQMGKYKTIYWVLLLIGGFLSLNGIGNWGSNLTWLNNFDGWIINHARFPGTFGIILGLSIGTVLLPETLRYWRQYLTSMEYKGKPASQLPQMTIHDVAEYLCNDSKWSCDTLCQFNLLETVRFKVPDEMTRAGLAGSVRYLGTRPESIEMIEIPRHYWDKAEIDRGRIWDRRNRIFTARKGFAQTGYGRYENGLAPRVDVERTWPRASWLRKKWARLYVTAKKCFFYLKNIHK